MNGVRATGILTFLKAKRKKNTSSKYHKLLCSCEVPTRHERSIFCKKERKINKN